MFKKNKVKFNRIKLLRLRPYLTDQLDFIELLKISEQIMSNNKWKNNS